MSKYKTAKNEITKKNNPSGDFQCSKIEITKLLPPLNPRVLLQLLHWKSTQAQADKAE